jgi:prevent-host-death family protein
MARSNGTWAVAKAKAKFSAVIDSALADGPQTITKHGRKTVVVVAVHEWERKTKRKGSLSEFFAASPLRGLVIRPLKRSRNKARSIKF